MNTFLFKTAIGMLFLALLGCNETAKQTTETKHETPDLTQEVGGVMTKEMQEELTPDAVLEDLLKGNERYVAGALTKRNLPAQVKATTNDQYPKAVILACIDSRVPVEYIFDQGVGDVFVVRVAGNIDDEELIGSMEYGLGVAGAKLLMVLGHENCGAIKSAIENVDVGSKNVDALLRQMENAILQIKGERDSKNKKYFDDVIKSNVVTTVADIREESPLINKLEETGGVKVVGAYYSLTDGKVSIIAE